jgi:excisionase family DNA binding protein
MSARNKEKHNLKTIAAAPSVIVYPRMMSIREVAHFLRVSVRTVYNIINDGHLTYSRVRVTFALIQFMLKIICASVRLSQHEN